MLPFSQRHANSSTGSDFPPVPRRTSYVPGLAHGGGASQTRPAYFKDCAAITCHVGVGSFVWVKDGAGPDHADGAGPQSFSVLLAQFKEPYKTLTPNDEDRATRRKQVSVGRKRTLRGRDSWAYLSPGSEQGGRLCFVYSSESRRLYAPCFFDM